MGDNGVRAQIPTCHPERKHKALGLCRSCYNALPQEKAKKDVAYAEWAARNPSYHRDKHLRKKYGISLAEYDDKLVEQQGRCAICGTAESGGKGRFHVDHDHDSGKVRALLCFTCNAGLGSFHDDPELLRRAADYLEAHR